MSPSRNGHKDLEPPNTPVKSPPRRGVPAPSWSSPRYPPTETPTGPSVGTLDPLIIEMLAELSRKLSWAISSSWETHTGQKPPKGTVASLAARYAQAILADLQERYYLTHHSQAPVPPPGA